jgi:hypothetical protein
MKRIVMITLFILGLAAIALVAGCGKSGEPASPAPTTRAGGEGAPKEQRGEEDRVVVSRSIDFAQVNERPYAVFVGKEEIDAFAKAIKTGDKMKGVLDIDFPDYDIVIDQKGTQRKVHMWLDRNGNRGMYVFVGETGTGFTMTEKATKELIGLIWGIRYDSDMAAANGDVVSALSGGVLNAERWLSFVGNMEDGERDEVQVVHYTIEGDPIFRNLIYDGHSFRLRYDTTHDAYGAPLDRTDFCQGVQADETDEGTVYTLTGCGDSETWFELMLPGK